eukprot:g38798.t1
MPSVLIDICPGHDREGEIGTSFCAQGPGDPGRWGDLEDRCFLSHNQQWRPRPQTLSVWAKVATQDDVASADLRNTQRCRKEVINLLHSIRGSFPGNLQLIFVLRPSRFIQRTIADIGIRLQRDDFKMKVP